MRPIHAGQKSRQLRGVHPHNAGHDGRPFESAAIEPLPVHHKAAAIPDDNLYPVGALRTEDHRHALHRVMASVSFAKSARPSPLPKSMVGSNVNHEASGWLSINVPAQRHNTSLSTARPGVPRTSTRAPRNSTVTTAASGDAGSQQPPAPSSDTKGTNDSVSAEVGAQLP